MIVGRVEFYPDVLEEFFEELDFLWSQREAVVFASDWTLRDLAELEERAEAHLDGLRLSGADGIDLARPSLRGEEQGPATAAAFVLMEGRRPDLDAEIVRALVEAEAPAKEGIGIALRHTDAPRIAQELRRLATEHDPLTRSIAVDILAFHRLGPPPPRLFDLFAFPDPAVRARACAAAGRFGGPWGPDDLQAALDQEDAGVRWAAIHASARLGMPGLQGMLRGAAARTDAVVPEAIEFLGALGDPSDLQILRGLLARPASRSAALAALGASGQVAAVPQILEAIKDPAVAVPAGKAFLRISGALGTESAEPLPPPAHLSQEEREFHEPQITVDPEKARAWWERDKGRFEPAGRWQCGLEIGREPLGPRLDLLPLAYRRDACFAACTSAGGPPRTLELEAMVRLQAR